MYAAVRAPLAVFLRTGRLPTCVREPLQSLAASRFAKHHAAMVPPHDIEYRRLAFETPPKVIRSENERAAYLAQLQDMDERWGALTDAERELFETLKLLVDEYERRGLIQHHSDPVRVIRELMQENGLKQKDLVGIFETPSVVSEVLSGKRRLTKDHVRRLSARFNEPVERFL